MSSKGRCTTTSIYLPGDGYTLEKVALTDVTLWTLHPVSAHLTRITTWKDLKDLDKAALRARVQWDHAVLVCPTDVKFTKDELSTYLGDEKSLANTSLRRVYLDEDTARGRQKIPLLHDLSAIADAYQTYDYPRDIVERAGLIKWLAATNTDAGQRELRDLGAPQIANLLFGDATRRDLIATLGAALLRRGPTGQMGSRVDVAALAAAAATHLTPDRLADILSWPVAPPAVTWTPEALIGLGQALGPLSDLDRHKLLEALVLEHAIFARRRGPIEADQDRDDYDYDDYRDYGDYDDNWREYAKKQILDSVTAALTPHSPEISDWLEMTGDAESLVIPRKLSHQVALAGALSVALVSAGITLPTPVRSFNERLRSLIDAAIPEAYGWAWPKYWAALENKEVKEFGEGARLCLPNSPRELRSWGETMGNCIGTYTQNVESGRTLIAGVRDASGTLVANVSMGYYKTSAYSSWNVEEIKGRFNADLPNAQYHCLSNILHDQLDDVKTTAPINAVPLLNAGIISRPAIAEQSNLDRYSDLVLDEDLHDLVLQDIELTPTRSPRSRRPERTRPVSATNAPTPGLGAADIETLSVSIASQEHVDHEATKNALTLLAPLQELSLRNIVELVACYEPAAAYFDNARAATVRDALSLAADGHHNALDSLATSGCFVSSPSTAAAVISVLRSWFASAPALA